MSFLSRLKSIVTGKRPSRRRVVVLGSDGMDPRHFETLLKAGRMPNMQALLERGCYSRLKTTIPAESPVASGGTRIMLFALTKLKIKLLLLKIGSTS